MVSMRRADCASTMMRRVAHPCGRIVAHCIAALRCAPLFFPPLLRSASLIHSARLLGESGPAAVRVARALMRCRLDSAIHTAQRRAEQRSASSSSRSRCDSEAAPGRPSVRFHGAAGWTWLDQITKENRWTTISRRNHIEIK